MKIEFNPFTKKTLQTVTEISQNVTPEITLHSTEKNTKQLVFNKKALSMLGFDFTSVDAQRLGITYGELVINGTKKSVYGLYITEAKSTKVMRVKNDGKTAPLTINTPVINSKALTINSSGIYNLLVATHGINVKTFTFVSDVPYEYEMNTGFTNKETNEPITTKVNILFVQPVDDLESILVNNDCTESEELVSTEEQLNVADDVQFTTNEEATEAPQV